MPSEPSLKVVQRGHGLARENVRQRLLLGSMFLTRMGLRAGQDPTTRWMARGVKTPGFPFITLIKKRGTARMQRT